MLLVLLAGVFISLTLFSVNVSSQKTEELAENSSCSVADLSAGFTNERIGIFEGRQVYVPDEVFLAEAPRVQNVLGVVSSNERWVEVDLSDQKLRAWDGDQLFLETLVSTGLSFSPTPTGEFRIWTKFKATKMSGGEGRNYYYLPNVPYVMFFENAQVPGHKGYSLHGTYWHNDFGKQKSHGCVNLPTPIAEKLYQWTSPVLADETRFQRASLDNPGTRIVVHE